MAEIVGDVGEPGLAGADALCPFDGLGDGGVAGMGLVTQGREDEHVQVVQLGKTGLGNGADIGEIGGATEAPADDLQRAVEETNRLEAQIADGDSVGDLAQGDTSAVGVGGLQGKGVGEDMLHDGAGLGADVEGNRLAGAILMQVAERSEIVQAEDVVGVGVGVEDSVEHAQVRGESLFAKIRAGVDEDGVLGRVLGGVLAWVLGRLGPAQQHGGSQPAVVGIGAEANGAVAAERGHTHGGAGSKKAQRGAGPSRP